MVGRAPSIQATGSQSTDHSDYLILISLTLDEMLDAEEKQRLDRHLERCDSCRLQWSLWQVIDQKLRAAPAPEPSPAFPHLVAGRLSRQEQRRNIQIGLLLTALAVFVWSLSLAGIGLFAAFLVYNNLDGFTAINQFLTDAWAVAGVVGHSLWQVLIDLTATPAILGVAIAYLLISVVALVVWLLLIQHSIQPIRTRIYGN